MSEHITHVAIFEDAHRLMRLNRTQFPEVFLHCLEQYYDNGILCSGTRGNHTYAVPITEKYRGKTVKECSDQALQQLAGALGWISHRSADSTLNPLADQIDELQNPMFNGQDLKLYYEVVVMKEVYDSGKKTTGSPYELLSPATLAEDMRSNPAAKLVNIHPFETLMTNFYMREFLGLMSFTEQQAQLETPDELDAYLTNLMDHGQYFQENLSLYTAAYEKPDPMKMQEFVYYMNFYNKQDPLIQLVRTLQNGNSASPEEFKAAMQNVERQCTYAQALKLNYGFWKALGSYYNGNIDQAALREKLLM